MGGVYGFLWAKLLSGKEFLLRKEFAMGCEDSMTENVVRQ
jgi:hypothetical protein